MGPFRVALLPYGFQTASKLLFVSSQAILSSCWESIGTQVVIKYQGENLSLLGATAKLEYI